MKHMDISKRRKYIVGGAAAMAVAIASCGLGAYQDRAVLLHECEQAYLAESVSGGEQINAASETDAVKADSEDVMEQLTESLNVEEKDVYKDETVYVFANADGSTNHILVNEVLKNKEGKAELTDKTDLSDIRNIKGDETFSVNGDTITWQADGSDIYYQGTSTKEAPVSVKVTYYLDGREIAPEELAGKSGKVKIRFDYENNTSVTKEINGKNEEIKVPFVAVSGMLLGDNFTNVAVENGKYMTEGNANIVIGYAMPGLAESLDARAGDFSEDISFPDYFEVSADVTDFSLDMTMTLVMNGSAVNMAGEIDLSELDELVDSLTDASGQLADGSGRLAEGVDTLLSKMGDFKTGVSELKSGLDTLSNGTGTLASGISTVNASAQNLNAGITALDTALNTPMSDEQKQATANQASEAAKAAVREQFAEGTDTYNAIYGQASAVFTAAMNSEDTINAIYAGLQNNAELRNGLYTAVLTSKYQEACAGAAAAGGTAPSFADFKAGVDQNASASGEIYAYVDSRLYSMAEQIAAGIGAQGASAMGQSVTAACEMSAESAAGQAAGQAAVAGAEDAKVQIAQQIETVSDSGYSLVTGACALAAGTDTLENATSTLTQGISKLVNGAGVLSGGSEQLAEGVNQLAEGATTLDEGINQFNEEAIDKLADAYNGDVKTLFARVNAALKASAEYDTYTMLNDGDEGTTKFIIKTEGILSED